MCEDFVEILFIMINRRSVVKGHAAGIAYQCARPRVIARGRIVNAELTVYGT
jgi:hypothetical protein